MPERSDRNNIDGSGSGGLVASVSHGSPADDAGVKPGDRILALDGHGLLDVIDYQFRLEPGEQSLEVERENRTLALSLYNQGETDPGITFSTTLFDGVRTCRCKCVFCFVDQVPRGLRDSLYLRDDDYRLSFLHGNFITLNNLSADDMERIIEQRLSPLYVSVHATEPGVRARLMGCSRKLSQSGLDNLRDLGEQGIETHVQVVYCPGFNSGKVFEATVGQLAYNYTGIGSVGVVPVALADDRVANGNDGEEILRPVTTSDCIELIEKVDRWQSELRQQRGEAFVYAADEFYLRAGLPLLPLEAYGELDQYENGIGIAASFLAEAGGVIDEVTAVASPEGRVHLLTGTLAEPLVREAIDLAAQAAPDGRAGKSIQPLAARNRLFGPHVTVTGLLGGRDIILAVEEAGLGRDDLLVMPASALDSAGERFLDGVTLKELEEALTCRVMVL